MPALTVAQHRCLLRAGRPQPGTAHGGPPNTGQHPGTELRPDGASSPSRSPKLSPTQETHLVGLYRAGQHTTAELAELFPSADRRSIALSNAPENLVPPEHGRRTLPIGAGDSTVTSTPAGTGQDDDCVKAYDLAFFTTDEAAAARIVERYAVRRSTEPSNATGKQQMGVGQARSRLAKAVTRTVPFGLLMQTMVICWYALHGHHPDGLTARRLAEPWYQSKTEPSFEDMIAKLRRTFIAARFTPIHAGQIAPNLLHDYALAWTAAAA